MSTNSSKGTRWESAVRDFLNAELGHYWPDWKERRQSGASPFRRPTDPLNVVRPRQAGRRDIGDLHAWPAVAQNKDAKNQAAPTWLRDAADQACAAGFPHSVVVHKVRNANVRDGKVYVSVREFTRIRLALGLSSRQMWRQFGFENSKTLRGLDTSKWYFTTTVCHLPALISNLRASLRS